MKVKISVKKLFNMEQLIVSLKDGQRRYREQIAHMFSEHEDLKEKLTEAGCSLKRMDERIQAYMDENEELKQQVEDLKKQCVVLDEYGDARTEESMMLKRKIEELKS